MYAVIRTGGKQYRVAEGQWIDVEKLPVDPGADVQFEEVLLLGDDKGTTVGRPLVKGARVTATVLKQFRGPKVIIYKYRRRKNERRKHGHRQWLTRVQITGVQQGVPSAPVISKPAGGPPPMPKG